MIRRIIIFAFLVGTIPAGILAGAGTESPFAMGAGAADLALGASRIADVNSWTAPFWNPSGLAAAEYTELGGFHTRLFDKDVAYQYLGIVYPTLDLGSFGIGVFRLGVGGIEKRDASNLYLGEIDDNRLGIYFAYGHTLGGYDLGLSLSMEHHSIDQYTATSSPGLTLSVTRRWKRQGFFEELSSAVVIRNAVGSSMKLDNADVSYPVSGDLGLKIAMNPRANWNHDLSLYAKFSKIDALPATVSAGMEYSIGEFFKIRGGLQDKRGTVGVGLSVGQFGFDYAVVDRDLGLLHMFNLTSSFGRSKKERLEDRIKQREQEFNREMSSQLEASNERMLGQTLERGKMAFEEGDLSEAAVQYDRALFLARAADKDTSAIATSLAEVQQRFNEVTRLQQYNALLDSAQSSFNQEDFLTARYFASLALQLVGNSNQAQQIIDDSEAKLHENSSREDLIYRRILLSDSLVSYGWADEAINLLQSVAEVAPDDKRVETALKRARFERFRDRASQAYGSSRYRQALVDLDSALVYYPGHQWCEEMKKTVLSRIKSKPAEEKPTPPKAVRKLSPELKREVEDMYQEGRRLFTGGDIQGAIEAWERVERIAPDFQSVREYLVNAYKFSGVQLYSDGKLKEAVQVWQKAAKLMPDNKEISEYITRTEGEIKRLEELSYEP